MSKNSDKLFRGAYHYVTSPFGWRNDPITGEHKFHNGVDYGTKAKNHPQYALEEGVVVGCGTDSTGAKYVYVRYDRLGYIGLHLHLDSISVKKGQSVNAESIVGTTGKTGRTTGIHLHYGWFKIAEWVKPFASRIWENFETYVYLEKPVPAPIPEPTPIPVPTPTPVPTPIPVPTGLQVGDRVLIQNMGNGSSYGTAGKAYGKGWTRYITKIYPGRPFPYQVGNQGLTDSRNTTGFYTESAIKKI